MQVRLWTTKTVDISVELTHLLSISFLPSKDGLPHFHEAEYPQTGKSFVFYSFSEIQAVLIMEAIYFLVKDPKKPVAVVIPAGVRMSLPLAFWNLIRATLVREPK